MTVGEFIIYAISLVLFFIFLDYAINKYPKTLEDIEKEIEEIDIEKISKTK